MSKGLEIVEALLKANNGNVGMKQLTDAIDLALQNARIAALNEAMTIAQQVAAKARHDQVATDDDDDSLMFAGMMTGADVVTRKIAAIMDQIPMPLPEPENKPKFLVKAPT